MAHGSLKASDIEIMSPVGSMESLMAAKSLDVAIEAQTDFLKSAYEGAVSQATKMSELYADLAKDAMKPFEGFLPKVGK